MKKLLPILIAATVYLNPLYPVYAQNTRPAAASAPGALKPPGIERAMEKALDRTEKAEQGLANAENRIELAREKMASRAAQLKEKLAKFKNKVKAQRVENINSNLAKVNMNQTSYIQQILTKLSQLLERGKNLSTEAQAAGQDVSELNEAINDAQTAWNQANDANTAQMENDYTIEVSSESTISADAKAARDKLKTDLQAVREKVKDARAAIVTVFNTAKDMKGASTDGQ
jgi:DNA repair exonuclease SbcCD ATPase subunit